jgi:hypothetical protein
MNEPMIADETTMLAVPAPNCHCLMTEGSATATIVRSNPSRKVPPADSSVTLR